MNNLYSSLNKKTFEELEFKHQIEWSLFNNHSIHPAYVDCDCSFSNSLKERAKMPLSDEKIEDIEEFKRIFCHEAKLIVNCTDEELIDRRHRLENIVRNFRTRISKVNDEVAHRKEKMTKAQRDALEEHDRKYKVKDRPVEKKEEKVSEFKKATGHDPNNKEEKAISTMMSTMGWDYEQAKKFVGGK